MSSSSGANTRRFRVATKASPGVAAVYALRTDLNAVLWQADDAVQRCPNCLKEFSFWRRMHHCRACGLIYCGACCEENDAHDNERVCCNCLLALEELNHHAVDEIKERARLGSEATRLLATIDDRWAGGRDAIAAEEDESRVRTMESMRVARRYIDLSQREKIANVVGSVAQMERRRTRPIYGIRGGVLTLRVQRLRNLQPVKPRLTCSPFVAIEVGDQRKTGSPATRVATGVDARSVALDFSVDESSLFDVEDDRAGVIISVMDNSSLAGVTALVGVAYLNIRKMHVLQVEPDAAQHAADSAVLAATKHHANTTFAPFVEKGTATRPLCASDGKQQTSAQISIQWSFHPYVQDTTSTAAKQIMCPACNQRDADGFCMCEEQAKEAQEEVSILGTVKRVAAELHSREIVMRCGRPPGATVADNEPINQFASVTLPVMQETCCC